MSRITISYGDKSNRVTFTGDKRYPHRVTHTTTKQPVIRFVQSDTRPDVVHKVVYIGDEKVCTCEGFTYHSKCKH